MSMTWEDFNAMAVEFGLLIRWSDNSGSQEVCDAQRLVIERAMAAFGRVADAGDIKLDRSLFRDLVYEVASGERDITGRKVLPRKGQSA